MPDSSRLAIAAAGIIRAGIIRVGIIRVGIIRVGIAAISAAGADGRALAHARIVMLNPTIAGVLPNSAGSLFCVISNNVLRPATGVQGNDSVTTPGGASCGVTMRCPA